MKNTFIVIISILLFSTANAYECSIQKDGNNTVHIVTAGDKTLASFKKSSDAVKLVYSLFELGVCTNEGLKQMACEVYLDGNNSYSVHVSLGNSYTQLSSHNNQDAANARLLTYVQNKVCNMPATFELTR